MPRERQKTWDPEDEMKQGEQVLRQVANICSSLDLSQAFEAFAERHIDAFLDDHDGEHSHECYEVYQLYLETFEKRIEDEIERSCGREGVRSFYRAARAELDDKSGRHCPNRFFLEALLATTQYGTFFDLMKHEARRIRFSSDNRLGKK